MLINIGTGELMALNNISWSGSYDLPPNIAVDYAGWTQWLNKRVAQFELRCPLFRTINYYFAQSGNDSTGDGSQTSPWKTLAKAQTLHDAAATNANICFNFNRGDVWRETAALVITKDNITIRDYGSGDKPIWTIFTAQYSSGWALAAGNRYTRSETNDIAWVADSSDRLGIIRGTPLIRLGSSAAVDSTPNSFFWGSNVLHINLGGTNPNTLNLEAVISNNVHGVIGSGDGIRIHNIVTHGYGCHRTLTANQIGGFTFTGKDDQAMLISGCESYYNSSHNIALYAAAGSPTASGGHLMAIDCVTGWSKYNASGETQYNAYAAQGGQEAWFINSQSAFGTLPSSDWAYATDKKRGRIAYNHTSGGSFVSSLWVCYNCDINGTMYPSSLPPQAYNTPDVTTITDSRVFVVNCDKPANAYYAADYIEIPRNGIVYGCKYYAKPSSAINSFDFNDGTTCWFINCYFELDPTNCTGSPTLWNATSNDNNFYLYHCWINWVNLPDTSQYYGYDYDNRFSAASAPDAATRSRNVELINSITTYSLTGGSGQRLIALNNNAVKMKNNAYYQVTQRAGLITGYDNDAGKVALSSLPVWNVSNAQLLLAGSNAIVTSHDINGKARTVLTPDIGPVDFSS